MRSNTLRKNFQSKSTKRRVVKESILKDAIPVFLVENNILDDLDGYYLSKFQQNYLIQSGFSGEQKQILYLPNKDGEVQLVFVGHTNDFREIGALIGSLTPKKYKIYNDLSQYEYWNLVVGFLISEYDFDYYQTSQHKLPNVEKNAIELSIPDDFEVERVSALVNSDFLARDLINMPPSDLGPEEFENVVSEISKDFNAVVKVIKGNELLRKGFPLIHAVGRASISVPRLIELSWGKKSSPAITLIGKGVCFDSGGLNLKTSASMNLMKKDMGGGAIAVALASYIMSQGLNIFLRLLIPVVENSVSSDSFRPGDILRSRMGKTIEINNTDAEGRLILADAITYANEADPFLIICMATLTGAARVGLGSELVPFYCTNDKITQELEEMSKLYGDPIWRMPFYEPYRKHIKSKIADLDNAPSGAMAGSITAALFLKEFIEDTTNFVHFDLYAWSQNSTSVWKAGARAQTLATLAGMLERVSERTGNNLNVSIDNKVS